VAVKVAEKNPGKELASDDAVGLLTDPLGVLDATGPDGRRADVALEADADVEELELLEFLAADLDPVPADPAFRRRLGELLWDMVRDGRVARPRNH